MRTARLAASIAALLAWESALAAPPACTASSGATLTPLIELYTSEGCSSCPPADRWLAGLQPGRVVPLALHVDYWDYIGWRDRYAEPRFSARQRDGVRRTGGRVVYTPQVLLDGRDFRRWGDASSVEKALREIAARPAQASLTLTADGRGKGAWAIRLEGRVAPRKGQAAAYLAVYESGLESDVRAGENKGARLRHSHVVREWIGPLAAGADGRIDYSRELSRPDIAAARAGIAAFVEDTETGEVLQALTLPFCAG